MQMAPSSDCGGLSGIAAGHLPHGREAQPSDPDIYSFMSSEEKAG